MPLNIFKGLGAQTRAAMIKIFGLSQNLTGKDDADIGDINVLLQQAMGQIGYNPAYASIYTSYVRSEIERRKQYKEYDTMEDESEVIATALDIYGEDATDYDSFVGARVWVTSDDDELAAEANAMIQRVGVEKRLPRIARNTAKYGDFFLGVQPDKREDKDKREGILRIDTSFYPRDVMPIIRDYKLLGYWVLDTEKIALVQDDMLKAPWEFVHFAVPGDANFVTYDTPMEYELKRSDVAEYGQSLLKAARKPYKRSKLMHDILAIARITRSPLKRVFKFQTDSNNPLVQIRSLAMFKKTMEKIGGVDKLNETMQYDELMNIATQDIYLPIGKDSKGDYAFDHIGGDVDVKAIADVEMFDNRLYMSLRIPKEFLNFDKASGDKSTLLIKDVRYAKRIKKLQNALKTGIKELIFIHFALKGKVVEEKSFEVHMASTSVSEDLERLDYYQAAVQTARALSEMLDMYMIKVEPSKEGEPVENRRYDREYLAYYILKHVVKLPNFDLVKYNPKMEDYAEEAEKKDEEKTSVQRFVESNKGLIDTMFRKRIGTDLREAAEEMNNNISKGYREDGIPEDFSWDHDRLRDFLEGMMKTKAGAENKRIIE